MTTSPLPAPPPLHFPSPDDDVPDHEDQARHAVELAALHRAADTGEAAARWVQRLADRQGEKEHGRLLERTAEAIVKASSREIIPGSDGLLTEELRHTLAADVVLGASHTTGTLPELRPGERTPLIAVCSIAAALPACVLGNLPRELEVLAAEMEAATAAGLAAAELPAAG
ncbi:hypothetical protein [Kitasatospora sp. NPDC004272]